MQGGQEQSTRQGWRLWSRLATGLVWPCLGELWHANHSTGLAPTPGQGTHVGVAAKGNAQDKGTAIGH